MARSAKNVDQVHLRSYVIGYLASLILTLVAFWMVYRHVSTEHVDIPHTFLIPLLAVLALAQFIVQIVFFLHLGNDTKQRWKTMVFWFMILVVVILVGGSLWIMNNLNYNMMDPARTRLYMHDHEGF